MLISSVILIFRHVDDYLLRIIFMKRNIYFHEEKYLFTWKKIIIFMKIIRCLLNLINW